MAIEKIDKGSRQYFCNFMLCGGLYGGTCTSPEIETEPLDDLNEIADSILNKAASITENGTVKVNAMFGPRPNIYKCFHGTFDCLKRKCQAGDAKNYVAAEHTVLTPRTLTFTMEETEVRDTDVDDAEVQPIWTNSSLSFSEEGKKVYSSSSWDSVSDTVFDDSHTDFPQSNNAVEATENDNTTNQNTLIDQYVPVPPKGPAPKRAFYRFRRCQLQEKMGLYAKPLCAPHELHVASSPLGSSPTLENHPETTARASDGDISRDSSIKHSESPVDVGWKITNPYPVWSEEISSAGAEKESSKESTKEESTKESSKEESTKESSKEESTKESSKEESSKESTKEESTKESTKEKSTKENSKEESSKESSTKESTKEESTKEESTKESTKEESKKESKKEESTKVERPTPNPIKYPVLPPVGLTPSYFPVNKHHLPQLIVPRKARAGRLPCRPVGLRSLPRVPKDRNLRQLKASAELDWKILEKTPRFMKSSLGSTPFLRT